MSIYIYLKGMKGPPGDPGARGHPGKVSALSLSLSSFLLYDGRFILFCH